MNRSAQSDMLRNQNCSPGPVRDFQLIVVCVECVLPASEWLLFPPGTGCIYFRKMYELI